MDPSLVKILFENGYILHEKPNYTIIKKRVVRSKGEFMVFFFTGMMLVAFGSFFVPGLPGVGIGSLILGMVLIYIPFFGYISAPYRGLTINKEDGNLLFRSKMSRAYKFSEIESLEIVSENSDSDTNPFSSSNKEYRYRVYLHFVGNVKEELFKFADPNDIIQEVRNIKDYFVDILQ